MTADEGLDVQIGNVIVEGGLPGFDEPTHALQAALASRRVTLGFIQARTRALEQAYADRGLFLVRVVLPPQRLADGGPLRVAIVDGYIEAVDASGVPERVRAVVQRTLEPLIGHRGLTLAEAERRLLLAGSSAGLTLRSTLVAGEGPGATRLVLDGTHRVASTNVRLGNTQPRALGRLDAQATIAVNSPFGSGERLYAALGTGRSGFDQDSEHGSLRLVSAGAVLPLGIEGWSINPEFTETVTRPAPEPGVLRTRGRLVRSALRLGLPALSTRQDIGLGGQLALEQVEQTQTASDFGVELSRDRYCVLRLGLDAAATWGGAGVTYSRGLGGRQPAAPQTGSVPLSRAGARADFDRLGLSVHGGLGLGGGWSVRAIALGQLSFGKPLLTSEQFALSGPDAVSGYAPGSFPVDQGVTLRAELALPAPHLPVGARSAVAPYAFAAAGRGHLFEPTTVEHASVRARSAGFGLRLNVPASDANIDLQLEAARHLGNSGEPGGSLQMTLNFGF